MFLDELKRLIGRYDDFPQKGIIFRDILPVLRNPRVFGELINHMSKQTPYKEADAILAIDARGFIFGSAIAKTLSMPLVLARKPGKLPGTVRTSEYNLEYGSNSLSIQEEAVQEFKSFVIVDDLLATGGTVECVKNLLNDFDKKITGLSVVIELNELNARNKFDFDIFSLVQY